MGGLTGGVRNFVGNIGKHLKNNLLDWAFQGRDRSGLSLSDPSSVGRFLLRQTGVSWDSVVGVLVRKAGPGNVALLSRGYGLLQQVKQGGSADLLKTLQDKAQLQPAELMQWAITAGLNKVKGELAKKGLEALAANSNPFSQLYETLKWVFDNGAEFGKLAENMLVPAADALTQSEPDAGKVAAAVEGGLKGGLGLALNFLMSKFRLTGLRAQAFRRWEAWAARSRTRSTPGWTRCCVR